MLSKNENRVMNAVYERCGGKSSLLISPIDLLKIIGTSLMTLTEIEKAIIALSQDGYFDLVYSDRHGETVYCITLSSKGLAFKRNSTVMKRNLIFRLGLSVVFALVSFVIGLILKAIF